MSNLKNANRATIGVNTLGYADARCIFRGVADEAARFITENSLLDTDLWRRFVTQFREHSDSSDYGWRGEYFGKMMRGACFVCDYTHDAKLYVVLRDAVLDILSASDPDGRISSYSRECEFHAWDIWCRKYVMLGMEYFLEICDDSDLSDRIISSLRAQADCIMAKIGSASEGKLSITHASANWRGLNSSSLLEPIVRLYNLTGDDKYLYFADYIVNEGGTSVANVFELACKNELAPYQYPITKAYELTSCFEGLLEYYRVKRIQWHKEALVNYANRLIETELTMIGCSGCTHELFDHSAVRQASSDNGNVMQETCVCVTLMKFFGQMTLLTGDPRYMDAFEISFYNAYLGSINTEGAIDPAAHTAYPNAIDAPLTFDSYSPLTVGKRGNGVGGLKLMSDGHYFGCCACIGAAGVGLFPKNALMLTPDGIALNLYEKGIAELSLPSGDRVLLDISTDYPRNGRVEITVDASAVFTLRLRNPSWSKNTVCRLNDESIDTCAGYISIKRKWQSGDKIVLEFDMSVRAHRPIAYGSDILMNKVVWREDYIVPTYVYEDPSAKNRVCITRGPLVLAAAESLGYDPAGPFDIVIGDDDIVDAKMCGKSDMPYKCIVKAELPLADSRTLPVCDYASSGKLWSDNDRIAAWINTKGNY